MLTLTTLAAAFAVVELTRRTLEHRQYRRDMARKLAR